MNYDHNKPWRQKPSKSLAWESSVNITFFLWDHQDTPYKVDIRNKIWQIMLLLNVSFLLSSICRYLGYMLLYYAVVHHIAPAAFLLASQCFRIHHSETLRHCCELLCKHTVKFLRGGYLLLLNFTPAGPIFGVPLKRGSHITMRLLHSACQCRNWLLSLFQHILQLSYFIQRWHLSQLEW